MPVWHASVSVWVDGQLVPTAEQSAKVARRAQALALELLEGVGLGPDRRERFGLAWHLRRRLTEAELRRIPQAWHDLPAVHIAGTGEPW